jgi:hypothetical protein
MAKKKAAKKKSAKKAAARPERGYTGNMGEHLVMAELLARGFNVARAVVDEGVDVIAFKPDNPLRLFRLQVKASHPVAGGGANTQKFLFTLKRSAYQKNASQDYYLILVMRDAKKSQFVIAILPKITFDDYVAAGDIIHWNAGQQSWQIGVHLRDNGTITMKNAGGTDVTQQVKDRWDRIS